MSNKIDFNKISKSEINSTFKVKPVVLQANISMMLTKNVTPFVQQLFTLIRKQENVLGHVQMELIPVLLQKFVNYVKLLASHAQAHLIRIVFHAILMQVY